VSEFLKLLVHYSMLIVSFVDRDMVMRHFGFGIGHVNSTACDSEHNNLNEDHRDSGTDSESESNAMDLITKSGLDISKANNSDLDLEDSDRDSKSYSSSNSSSGSSESGSSDDDGYASF